MKKAFLSFLFMMSFVGLPAQAKTFEETCLSASGTVTTLEERSGKKTNLCVVSSFLACTEEQLLSGACSATALGSYEKSLTNTSSSTCNIFSEYFWSPELGKCASLPDFLNYIKESDSKTATTTQGASATTSLTSSILQKLFGTEKKPETVSTTTPRMVIGEKTTTAVSLKPEICLLPASLLKLGSSSDSVKTLQQDLIKKGFLSITSPTTYFGLKTKDAVTLYQKSAGVTPASGIFGEITRASFCK